MKKRDFLAAALTATTLPALATSPQRPSSLRSPAVLTVAGNIGRTNRPPMHPELDPVFKRQGADFKKAFEFDFAALTALPVVSFKTQLDMDAKVHAFGGPLLTDVIAVAGANVKDSTVISMRALDGYTGQVTVADARKYRHIVATHMDGHPMAVGGLGPLYIIFEAEKFKKKMAIPVADRFPGCPWALYYIEVAA